MTIAPSELRAELSKPALDGIVRWLRLLGVASGYASLDATALVPAAQLRGWVPIATVVASSSASISFGPSDFDPNDWDELELILHLIRPASDGVNFNMRIGTGATPTFQTTSYRHANHLNTDSATSTAEGSTSTTIIPLALSVGNAADEAVTGKIRIATPGNSGKHKHLLFETSCLITDASVRSRRGSGVWDGGTDPITGFQFTFGSGNIADGSISLRGFRV